MKLYFDGGCQPNPGQMEAAVVSGDGSIQHHQPRLGIGTSNEAEWIGLIGAIKVALSLAKPVTIHGDSLLVVNQANGLWKCKADHLKPYVDQCAALLADASHPIGISHIGRKLNKAGKHLEALQKARAPRKRVKHWQQKR